MTGPEYIAFLESMGVTLKVHGEKLQVSPARAVGPGTLSVLKAHKPEIIEALLEQRQLSTSTQIPKSAASSESVDSTTAYCPRCQSNHYIDVPIHNGQSTRRDCAKCNRFLGWPLWQGGSS